jgi:hypothetical protein
VNENNPDRNLYRDHFNGDELFKIKEICENLTEDSSLVIKAMNNDFVTFLCSKNVNLIFFYLSLIPPINSLDRRGHPRVTEPAYENLLGPE